MITSCSPAGSSSTMRCMHGSNTPRGSVIPGTRSAPPPPSDVQGHTDRTLAPAVPPDSAEDRLLPCESVARGFRGWPERSRRGGLVPQVPFFFYHAPPTEIYTLSLDALPIAPFPV